MMLEHGVSQCFASSSIGWFFVASIWSSESQISFRNVVSGFDRLIGSTLRSNPDDSALKDKEDR